MCSLVTSYCPLSLLMSRVRLARSVCRSPSYSSPVHDARCSTHDDRRRVDAAARPPSRRRTDGDPSSALLLSLDRTDRSHSHADVIFTCQRLAELHLNNLPKPEHSICFNRLMATYRVGQKTGLFSEELSISLVDCRGKCNGKCREMASVSDDAIHEVRRGLRPTSATPPSAACASIGQGTARAGAAEKYGR